MACCPERHSKDAAALCARAATASESRERSRAVLYGLRRYLMREDPVHTVHGGGSAQRTFRAPNRD